MKQPAVYMLASQRNGTLYIGVTSDLIKRIWQHREGLAEGFTKQYGVKMLVWYEQHATMQSAIAREKAMKKWRREWKIKTIEQGNPDWSDLWFEINGIATPVLAPPLVIPAHAGIHQNKDDANSVCSSPSNPLDSRMRGNDGGVEALL